MNVRHVDGVLIVADDGSHTQQIRKLPSRKWDSKTGTWTVPHVVENWEAMVKAGFPIRHIQPPTLSAYRVERVKGNDTLLLTTLATKDDVAKCKRIPQYRFFSPQHNGWVFKPTKLNLEYVAKAFSRAQWSKQAKQLARTKYDEQVKQVPAKQAVDTGKVLDFKFHTKPYQHQVDAFLAMRDRTAFGLFMEQGTGKTKVLIDEITYHFQKGEITGALIICPNSVKDTWEEEVETHMHPSVSRQVFVWGPKTRHKAKPFIFNVEPGDRPLKILVMNVEALSGSVGVEIANLFVSKYSTYMAVDESTRIKTPSAARTKKAILVGKKAKFRRIASGTPVTQSPLDIFTQFKFLDPNILGFSSYYSFRNHFAIMGGWNDKQVVGYANLEELADIVAAHSFRVLKKDCLDLPEKLFEKRYVELSPEQQRIYDQMDQEMMAELDGQQINVQYVITKIMRLQQIVGGFFPGEKVSADGTEIEKDIRPIPGPNQKLEALLEILDDLPAGEKAIIWAKFRPELDLIAKTLRERYGAETVVEFHGGIKQDGRKKSRKTFQDRASPVRWFVGQPETGGIGLTLTAGSTVIYYSNDSALETRLQSEDRAHRISALKNVTYIDIVARKTRDVVIVASLRAHKKLADVITKDPSLNWI